MTPLTLIFVWIILTSERCKNYTVDELLRHNRDIYVKRLILNASLV